ncbi:TusE/DsrC/DsvC family sulfur relay protein [candidate division KSB1 bacterium]
MSSQAFQSVEESHQDPFGFPLHFKEWSREKVLELAEKNEIGELTEDHWKVIDYVHDYYVKYNRGPTVISIAKHCGFSSKKLCGDLFPCGVVKGAFLLAGLPRPSGCIG